MALSPQEESKEERTERLWRRGIVCAVLCVLVGVSISYIYRAVEGKGAFHRWRPHVTDLVSGKNLYAREHLNVPEGHEKAEPDFPTAPIVAVALRPLYWLSPVPAAIIFAIVKLIATALAVMWAIQMACGESKRGPPAWAVAVVILLAARPIVSDIQHGNINLFVLFLVMAALRVFSRERPVAGGVIMGFAIMVKVTPGLFVPYFMWKREWKAVVGCAIGMVIAAFAPALVLGFQTNLDMLVSWFDAMIMPFVRGGGTEYTEQINQSLPGVFMRLTTETIGIHAGDEVAVPINLISLRPETAAMIVRVMLLAVVGWLAFVCRTRSASRADWRLVCEWGLILIAMLIMSERSWKHHYVTIVLPIACVVMHVALRNPPGGLRRYLSGTLIAFGIVTLLTSGELIGWMYKGIAHKYVEAFGSFFVGAILLFAALSVLVLRGRRPDGQGTIRRSAPARESDQSTP